MNILVMSLIALLIRIAIPTPQAPASIEGVVIKLGTGEPLANAGVQLKASLKPNKSAPLPKSSHESFLSGSLRVLASVLYL